MKTRAMPSFAAALVVTVLYAAPAAALDVVACLSGGGPLQITGDPRNCPADRRIDAISVSVDFKNLTTDASGSGSGAGKPTASDLKLAKRLDGTSGTLFLAVVTGAHYQNLLVTAYENDQRGLVRRVFSILLTDVSVTQHDINAEDSQRTGLPTEIATFRYSRFQLRDDQTGQTTGYDFKTGNRL